MFQHQNIWLPDGEKHFVEWMNKSGEIVDGKGTYQIKKLREAMKWCGQSRVAVDVGAHVGLWSMHLAKRFENVIAFEPVAGFRKCFAKNAWIRGVKLFPCALGAAPGKVRMVIDPADTGGTHVAQQNVGDHPGWTELRTLDSFDLQGVDFIKIDCEGYEAQVIVGARETLKRCRPCVIVEQKQHIMSKNSFATGTPAVNSLLEMGAQLRTVMSGDYILSWDA